MKLLQCNECHKVYYVSYDYWNFANEEFLQKIRKEKVEVVFCKCPECIKFNKRLI